MPGISVTKYIKVAKTEKNSSGPQMHKFPPQLENAPQIYASAQAIFLFAKIAGII